MAPRDPGRFDEEELARSIERGRLDVDLLAARAFTGDVAAMCMYARWLDHLAGVAAIEGEPEEELALARESRRWLTRAMELGSWQAAAMLGARPVLELVPAGR